MAARFSRVIDLFNEHGVEFIVIGGLAMGLHGSAHRTQDLDVLYRRSAENVARLVAALRSIHPRLRVAGEPHGLAFVCDDRTVSNGNNFTLVTDLGDVDIFGAIAGIGSYEDALQYVELFRLAEGKAELRVLSLQGLIVAKRSAGRPTGTREGRSRRNLTRRYRTALVRASFDCAPSALRSG